MFGECHAHALLNGENYREAVELHKDHVCTEKIREYLMEYQKRDVLFVRDGGDGLGVSQTAAILAPEYGITYRTPMFAIHKNGHYGGIVGKGFDDLKELSSAGERGQSSWWKLCEGDVFRDYGFLHSGDDHRHASS